MDGKNAKGEEVMQIFMGPPHGTMVRVYLVEEDGKIDLRGLCDGANRLLASFDPEEKTCTVYHSNLFEMGLKFKLKD